MIRIILLCTCAVLSGIAEAATREEAQRLKQEQKLAEAERAFEELLREQPDDASLMSELATVQGWQGRHDEAIVTWRRALDADPESLDIRLGLARVLYWRGRRDDSLQQLAEILGRDPDHFDALLLKGDVLIANGDPAGARESYQRAQSLERGSDDRDIGVLLQRTAEPARWRLDTGHAVEDYSNERGAESGTFMQLGYRFSDRTSGYVRLDGLRQFEQVDNQIVAGLYQKLAPRWLLWLEAGGTRHADFRPEKQGQVVLEWLLQGPLQPMLGYRQFEYAEGRVHTVTPGLRVPALGPGDLEFRYGISENLDDSRTAVGSLRYAFGIGRYTPYVAYYDGEEALPPQQKAKFTTWAVGSGFDPGGRWAVRLDYAYEDRRRFYHHHTVALGMTFRF